MTVNRGIDQWHKPYDYGGGRGLRENNREKARKLAVQRQEGMDEFSSAIFRL